MIHNFKLVTTDRNYNRKQKITITQHVSIQIFKRRNDHFQLWSFAQNENNSCAWYFHLSSCIFLSDQSQNRNPELRISCIAGQHNCDACWCWLVFPPGTLFLTHSQNTYLEGISQVRMWVGYGDLGLARVFFGILLRDSWDVDILEKYLKERRI